MMTKAKLPPRKLPIGVGFSSTHSSLFTATRRLLNDVELAEEAGRRDVEEIRRKFSIDAQYSPTLDVELYAMAVAVFAAMTIEAAIDLYRVTRFGSQHPRSRQLREPMWKYLGNLLRDATGKHVDDDELLLAIVRRTFETRNALVHPVSSEIHYDTKGRPIAPQEDDGFPELDGNDARRIVADLEAFFNEMTRLDPNGVGILAI